jgi:NAD(P)-dependent dehydrogenase (short-subunit alcohol dehydrogenase family)
VRILKRYVCITGADRGLGLAFTKQFLNQGYYVFAGQYLSSWKELDKLREEFPDQLDIVILDVSNDESVKKAGQYIASITDSVDILVNNAAIIGNTTNTIFDELDFNQILNVINVTGLGALRVTNALIPLVMNSETKLVVNISSEAGSIGQCSRKAWYGYMMAKASVNMQAAITHNTISEDGGQVLNFHPGWVQSYMGGGDLNTKADLTPDQSAEHLMGLIAKHKEYAGPKPAFIDYLGRPQLW